MPSGWRAERAWLSMSEKENNDAYTDPVLVLALLLTLSAGVSIAGAPPSSDSDPVPVAALSTGPANGYGPLPDKFLFAIGAQAPTGQLNLPIGIAAAADGSLFVADWGNRRIQHFSAQVSLWTPGDRWDRAMAVRPGARSRHWREGNVYVGDLYLDRIQRFSATGMHLSTWGSHGSDPGNSAASGGWRPGGWQHLYHRAMENACSASRQPVYLWQSGARRAPARPVRKAERHRCCSGGNVYVPMKTTTASVLHSRRRLPGEWGRAGSGYGEFGKPCAVAVGPTHGLRGDQNNARIQRFTASGGFLGAWAAMHGHKRVQSAPGITLTQQGSSPWPIRRTAASSSSGQRPLPACLGSTGLTAPSSVIRKASPSAAWAPCTWPTRTTTASSASTSKAGSRTPGCPGAGNGQLQSPRRGRGASGNVYVADTNNHRIQYFTPAGGYLGGWAATAAARADSTRLLRWPWRPAHSLRD